MYLYMSPSIMIAIFSLLWTTQAYCEANSSKTLAYLKQLQIANKDDFTFDAPKLDASLAKKFEEFSPDKISIVCDAESCDGLDNLDRTISKDKMNPGDKIGLVIAPASKLHFKAIKAVQSVKMVPMLVFRVTENNFPEWPKSSSSTLKRIRDDAILAPKPAKMISQGVDQFLKNYTNKDCSSVVNATSTAQLLAGSAKLEVLIETMTNPIEAKKIERCGINQDDLTFLFRLCATHAREGARRAVAAQIPQDIKGETWEAFSVNLLKKIGGK